MNFFFNPIVFVWKYRILIRNTTATDIRGRFAGSVLGLAWLIFYPLLFLGAYALIYLLVFQVRFQLFNSYEYVVLIFCGLIPFLGFAEALGAGVPSVSANSNLIKNTLFPIELIPVKAVLAAQATQLMGTVFLLIALAILGKLTIWVFLFPVIWGAQIMFSIGLIWMLASFNVFFKDLQNIVSIFILILMMVSPIAYTADMVPEKFRYLLNLNPLYYMIVSYQDALMIGQCPRSNVLWILIVLSFLFFGLGYWVFTRLKKVFADNL